MRCVVALALIVGCGPQKAPPAVVASAPAIDASVQTKTIDAGPSDSGAKPAKAITAEDRKSYATALAQGRKATVAGKYRDAIAAFGRALEAIPDDGRALSERGYARFLAKDLDGARSDFERALVSVPVTDKVLLAQVEFNLGLVDQQRGYKGDVAARKSAGVHFLRSHQLNPTKEARENIPRDCTVSVLKPNLPTYASRAEALAKLGGSAPIDSGPAFYVEVNEHGKVLLPIDGGRIARVDVGMIGTWHCGTLGEVAVTKSDGVYKVVYQAHRGMMSPGICFCEDGEPCKGAMGVGDFAECKCQSPTCPMVCGGADELEGWHIESYVDAKTGEALWQIELDHAQLATLKLDIDVAKKKFAVLGEHCSP